jgi:hypothetical protein
VAQEEISINSVLFVIVDELVKQRPFSDNVNRWNALPISEFDYDASSDDSGSPTMVGPLFESTSDPSVRELRSMSSISSTIGDNVDSGDDQKAY